MAASATCKILLEFLFFSSKDRDDPCWKPGVANNNRDLFFKKATKKFESPRSQHKHLCGMYACNVYARSIMQNLFVALTSFYVLFLEFLFILFSLLFL